MPEKILLVDDDSNNLAALGGFLRAEGYHVTEACDGGKAAELLKKDNFDLVLSDVIMPGMNGLQLAAFIQSLSMTVPILLMSASRSIKCAEAIE